MTCPTKSTAFRGPLPLLKGHSSNQGSEAFCVKAYSKLGDPRPANRQETATPDLVHAGGYSGFETHRRECGDLC